MPTVAEEVATALNERVPLTVKALRALARKLPKKMHLIHSDVYANFSPEAEEWIKQVENVRKSNQTDEAIPFPSDFHVDYQINDDALERETSEDDFETAPVDFRTRSTQSVVNVQSLISMKTNFQIKLPDCQRKLVWDNKTKWSYLTSLMLDIPSPNFYLVKDPKSDDKAWHILDGYQRLSCIEAFLADKLTLGPEGIYMDSDWKIQPARDKKFSQLPADVQSDFLMKNIGVYQIEQARRFWPYTFRQINKGGKQLNSIELRRATYQNGTMFMFDGFAENDANWKILFGKNNRHKGLQAILRAVAMHYDYAHYVRPMDKFLDLFCNKRVTGNPKDLHVEKLSVLWERLSFITMALQKQLEKTAFRFDSSNPINFGILDCVIHGCLLLLEKNPDITMEELGGRVIDLRAKLLNPDGLLRKTLKDNTSGREHVISRMAEVEIILNSQSESDFASPP